MRKSIVLLLALFSVFFMISCGGDTQQKGTIMGNELEGAPQWVLQNANTENRICGVGSAAGTRNPSLARTAAMGRGRTEISRTLETKVKAMLKDYQSTTTGGEGFGSAANDEQHIEDVSKQITNTTLSGSELKNTWISKTGTMYTLVCVDLEKFKDSVQKMQQLNEQVRQAVVERANKAFSELDAETK